MKRVNKLREEEENESTSNKHPRLCPTEAVRLLESHILTNTLITDRIFVGIPKSDLLHFSSISKAWNLTCRGILVDRFNTYLTLSEKSTVQVLEDLYNLISNVIPGHQHPVNGIRVNFDNPVSEWRFFSEPFVGLIRRIVNQIEVKFVNLDMSKLHLKSSDFHNIFKTLVIPHLGTIESLEIMDFHGLGNLKTLTQQLSVDSLPNLRKLDLDESQGRLKISTFKRILRACPNLKIFPHVFPYQLPILRNTNKLHLASSVRCNYMKLTPKDIQLLVEYSGLIKKLKITLEAKAKRNKFEEEWISRLKPLFSSQFQFSLEYLGMELGLLVAILLQNSFPPLTKLNELSCTGSQEWFPTLFKSTRTHLANFIPNLRSLTVYWTPFRSKFLERQLRDVNQEEGPLCLSLYKRSTAASVDSVRVLKLVGIDHLGAAKYDTLMKLMNLDEAFPWVTHLEINFFHSNLEDLFKWICESWGDLLKTLKLQKSECLRLMEYAVEDDEDEWAPPLGEIYLKELQHKRKTLPTGISYSEKLSHLRRLEVAFHHTAKGICERGYKQETTEARTTFKPRDGQVVKVLISGCRAQKRLPRVKSGVSVYETLLALRSCPQDSELSPIEEIIATESICTRLCKLLPTKDLLSVSLVNRRWNVAARNELYTNRSCALTINPLIYKDSETPRKLDWLQGRGLEIFNSLRIRATWESSGKHDRLIAAQACRLHLEDEGLKHTRFKLLEVVGMQATDAHFHHFHQVATKLQKFLKSVFQILELDHVQALVTSIENFDRLFRDDGGILLVPNLKTIEFVDSELLLDYPEVTKRIFQDLKYLERIESPVSNKLLPYIASVNKAHCVTHLHLCGYTETTLPEGENPSEDENSEVIPFEDPRTSPGSLLKFAQEHQPRLERLSIADDVHLSQKNEPVFGKVFQIICASSYESLSTLSLSLSHLRLVSKVFIHPMIGVKCLDLKYDQASFDSDLLLSQIQFHEMFPNLTQVCLQRRVRYRSVAVHSSPEEHLAETCKGNPQPCLSVRNIYIRIDSYFDAELNSSSLKSWNIGNVARIFPNVHNLTFVGVDFVAPPGNEFTNILSTIWKVWSNLEVIKMWATKNLDAVSFETWILGISEEEWSAWNELQRDESTGELVKTMHYAPSTFSFRNCKKLKEFTVNPNIQTMIVKRTNDLHFTRLRLFSSLLDEAHDHGELIEERIEVI